MALTGLHVACGYLGGLAGGFSPAPQSANILRGLAWSETLSTAGTTTKSVPVAGSNGDACLEISVSADAFVAIGPVPDAAAGPRILVRATETRRFIAAPGDKVAWQAA